MADHHRSAKKELVQHQLEQEALLDDPNFLKEILQKALQRILEAQMTAHIGAAPHERSQNRKGHRNGYKPRTL